MKCVNNKKLKQLLKPNVFGLRRSHGSLPQKAAQTAQPQKRERGLVTQIGETLDYALNSDGLTADALNALAAGANQLSGGRLQGLDDAVLGSEEQKARMIEIAEDRQARREAGEMSGVEQFFDSTANVLEGTAAGMEAGIAMPFTIAGRALNQDTPWSTRTQTLKNAPLGEAAFSIAEIVTPTLLTGGVAGAAGAPAWLTGGVGLTAESALETATQESADELIAGRTLAQKFGEIADFYGMDGGKLTQDLIEGVTPEAQAMNAAVGFVQNLGINFGADKLIKYFPKIWKKKVDDVAAVSGKDAEEVQKSLTDVNEPKFSSTSEPTDVQTIDSAVSVPKPSEGNKYINADSLQAEALRSKEGLDDQWLSDSNRSYFTNLQALSDDEGIRQVIDEITKDLKPLSPVSADYKALFTRVKSFVDQNLYLVKPEFDPLTKDMSVVNWAIDEVAEQFAKEMTVPLNREAAEIIVNEDVGFEQYLKELSKVDNAGFTAGVILGEELGLRLQKQATAIDTLETLGVDFTNAVENFFELQDKANLVLIPLRRGKRDWSVGGGAQQREFIRSITNPEDLSKTKEFGSVTDRGEALKKIYLNADDTEGVRPRELWDAYQQGSSEAGWTLKAYFNLIANGSPSTAVSEIDDMSKSSDQSAEERQSECNQAIALRKHAYSVGTSVCFLEFKHCQPCQRSDWIHVGQRSACLRTRSIHWWLDCYW